MGGNRFNDKSNCWRNRTNIKQFFRKFGTPESITHSNASQFMAPEFGEFCRKKGITLSIVPTLLPVGFAERIAKIIRKGLKQLNLLSVYDRIARVLHGYNLEPDTTKGITLAQDLPVKMKESFVTKQLPKIASDYSPAQRQVQISPDVWRPEKGRIYERAIFWSR